MKISADKLKALCKKRGMRLNDLLRKAKVSRTAYYHLLRKDDILPRSLTALAGQLDVDPVTFLEKPASSIHRLPDQLKLIEKICRKYPEADPDTVRHTILLMDEKPIERMRRGLLRAQNIHTHR